MSFSKCVDLARIRDYVYVKEKIIFFTEKEGTFHVFAFFPNENALYSAAFSQAFLKGMARKFNFQNMQLLLSWIRNEISNNRFILKSSNSGNINFTIGLNSPTQPSFLLSSSLNIVEFIISISNALLSSQTYIADLERGNEKSLDQLRVNESCGSSPLKRRTVGMSCTNPQCRERKPASGLVFMSEDGADEK